MIKFKKKAEKFLIPVLASTILLTPFASNVNAAEATANSEIIFESTFEEIKVPSTSELQSLGLSDAEIQKLLAVESSGIYLIDGVAFDKDGNELSAAERGKLSWATKILRASWNKLPKGVQDAIGGVVAFETLLNFIDHFTGTIEDAVYQGCLMLGMSSSVAWWVTKILTLLVL